MYSSTNKSLKKISSRISLLEVPVPPGTTGVHVLLLYYMTHKILSIVNILLIVLQCGENEIEIDNIASPPRTTCSPHSSPFFILDNTLLIEFTTCATSSFTMSGTVGMTKPKVDILLAPTVSRPLPSLVTVTYFR